MTACVGDKNMEENKYNKNRNFTALLYMEDKTHKNALEEIQKKYDHAFIEHNKDVNLETGELKKEHIHCVFRVGTNPRWRSAVAKELGITENYIEGCDLNKQLKYLIHWDNPNKYQYSLDEVEGNLKKRLKEIIQKEGKTEGERAREIIEAIENFEGYIDIASFSVWCTENGYWDVFRKGHPIFIKIIQNKNKRNI